MIAKIQRPYFIDWLSEWQDKDIIKVVTGIRRCGKTTLFELFREHLLHQGIAPSQIVTIDFEDPDLGEFSSYCEAWTYIRGRMDLSHRSYVFLDEVQLVPEFEKLVDGLFCKKDCDVYITGSNSKFLSGELATYLTGRYVEIQVHPLSFAEYRPLFPDQPAGDLIQDYLRYGGFPFAAQLEKGSRAFKDYLSGILSTIVYKDVAARKGFRETATLERLTRFIFDNIGNIQSVNRIVGAFKADGLSVPHATLDNFLTAICEIFLVFKVSRYDIKGKGYLKSNAKYYIADTGLRRILLGDKRDDQGHILENVVFLELKRRYQDVFVGVLGPKEVAFAVIDSARPPSSQVALTVQDPATLARELAPLTAIRDQHPKFLLTLDNGPPVNHDGIRQLSVTEFLLNPRSTETI